MELHPDYPLRTEQLALRPMVPGDDRALWSYLSLEEVCRYVPFGPYGIEVVRERLADQYARRDLTEAGQALLLGVTVPPSDWVVGHVMLRWLTEEHLDGEVGWMLAPSVHGRGYGTEAMAPVLRLGFEGLGLHRVVARIDARNEPSIALARRLGMREEAHLVANMRVRGEWTDEVDFALLEDEWRMQVAEGAER